MAGTGKAHLRPADETLVRIRPVTFGVTAGPFWISLTREGETEPFASRQVPDGLPGATRGAPIDFVLDPAAAVPPFLATIDSTALVLECSYRTPAIVPTLLEALRWGQRVHVRAGTLYWTPQAAGQTTFVLGGPC